MHRIVATCFKSIMYAIIFVIIWDVGFYLWRANVLNQRMESLAVSMQEVVSKNNYMPEGDYKMFKSVLNTIRSDMNQSDEFVSKIILNYGDYSSYQPNVRVDGVGNIARYRLDTPARYGDVMVIELKVGVNASVWGRSNVRGNGADSVEKKSSPLYFTYTYLVPCLKYTTVTD